MRNPLLAAVERVQTARPIPPRVEVFEQDRFRDGSDVDPADDMGPQTAEGYGDGTNQVVVDRQPDMRDPVPVSIVVDETRSREFPAWRTSNEYVDGSLMARRIVNQQRSRSKVKIKNLGAVRLWVGPEQNVTALNGYPIEPNGGTEEFTTTEDIWAVGEAGPCNIAIISHYSQNVEKQ